MNHFSVYLDWRIWMVGFRVFPRLDQADPLGQWHIVQMTIGPLGVALRWLR